MRHKLQLGLCEVYFGIIFINIWLSVQILVELWVMGVICIINSPITSIYICTVGSGACGGSLDIVPNHA